ncbi:MAG: 16S rRNA (cytosine(1402)-N(4))-methyltransferase RsmH [Pseudomonadales bacterium]|nr:16S rRNA (cytosine(1402)-N(4))-methyltransferase RsmH [Pseudomonadales bacterium]
MDAHQSVLSSEAISALVINSDGVFIDCTYGRGGHSKLILEQLSERGRLIVIDKDLAAIEDAQQKLGDDGRVTIVHGSFRDIAEAANQAVVEKVDGILIDLGVSSPQLDQADRGFSFNHDGPLDMRMDQSQGQKVSDWLATAAERDIRIVLKKYGEEKFAKRIAAKIVVAREIADIETTHQLVSLIEEAIPFREPHKHPATRSFQALRIFINDELQDLETCLDSTVPLLAPLGRLVVISFHSLEDRIVKRFMRLKARGEPLPSRLPIRDDQIKRYLKLLGKPIRPSDEEVRENRRSRSSIMRVAEKI